MEITQVHGAGKGEVLLARQVVSKYDVTAC